MRRKSRFGRMGGRGGMGLNMGRGALSGAGKSVDHRPKTILVAGLTHDESQQLTNYIAQQPGALTTTTGGTESNGSDTASTTVNLVASFARRVVAEQALNRIKAMFPNANANWLQQQGIPAKKDSENVPTLTSSAVQASSVQLKPALTAVSNGITQKDDLDDDVKMNQVNDFPEVSLEDEEALLMGSTVLAHGADAVGDEEEEEAEEEEERSWRR